MEASAFRPGVLFRVVPAKGRPRAKFSHDAYLDWCASSSFKFLSNAIASPSTDGQRRAATGGRLLARASAERRPDLKMLSAVMALEAWLLPHVDGPQAFRLARHVTSFACRRNDGRPCGGTAPDCPYLRLDPDDKQDLTRLKKLHAIRGAWTCSEWFRILDWYKARSDAAHGLGGDASHSEASSTEYVISHYLLDAILGWLAFHPEDPTGDLDRELCLVVDEAGWQNVVSAIDEPPPPPPPVC